MIMVLIRTVNKQPGKAILSLSVQPQPGESRQLVDAQFLFADQYAPAFLVIDQGELSAAKAKAVEIIRGALSLGFHVELRADGHLHAWRGTKEGLCWVDGRLVQGDSTEMIPTAALRVREQSPLDCNARCFKLAEYFLSNRGRYSRNDAAGLAEHIQESIELYLRYLDGSRTGAVN